jgi:hypothetical protein
MNLTTVVCAITSRAPRRASARRARATRRARHALLQALCCRESLGSEGNAAAGAARRALRRTRDVGRHGRGHARTVQRGAHELRRPARDRGRQASMAASARHGAHAGQAARRGRQGQLIPLDVVDRLCDEEKTSRLQGAIIKRVKAAKFPEVNTVDGFDFDWDPCGSAARSKSEQLRSLSTGRCVTVSALQQLVRGCIQVAHGATPDG